MKTITQTEAESHSRPNQKAARLEALSEAALPNIKELRLNFLRNLDPDKFISFMKRINGVIRGTPICEREFDGQTVVVGTIGDTTYLPPANKDKMTILKSVVEAAQNIEDPKKAAALLYYAAPFLH
ncbi:MAG: hypothetical protein KDD42_06560, partial [Bdellovibrionales bacterium]|nr:hypothetical protein [Bdellovibrionales bacterium]